MESPNTQTVTTSTGYTGSATDITISHSYNETAVMSSMHQMLPVSTHYPHYMPSDYSYTSAGIVPVSLMPAYGTMMTPAVHYDTPLLKQSTLEPLLTNQRAGFETVRALPLDNQHLVVLPAAHTIYTGSQPWDASMSKSAETTHEKQESHSQHRMTTVHPDTTLAHGLATAQSDTNLSHSHYAHEHHVGEVAQSSQFSYKQDTCVLQDHAALNNHNHHQLQTNDNEKITDSASIGETLNSQNENDSVSFTEARLGLLKVLVYLEDNSAVAPDYVPILWKLFKVIETAQRKKDELNNEYVLSKCYMEMNINLLHGRIHKMIALNNTNLDAAEIEMVEDHNEDENTVDEEIPDETVDKINNSLDKPVTRGRRRGRRCKQSVTQNHLDIFTDSESELKDLDRNLINAIKSDLAKVDYDVKDPDYVKTEGHVSDDGINTRPKRRGRKPKFRNGVTCTICNKKFKNASHLREHTITHTDVKPFKCETCGKGFRRQSYIKQHQMLHTGEKPYVCTKCEKGFRTSGELRQHQASHSGIKPYSCKDCSATFVHATGLKSHRRIHTGERPYKCGDCGLSLAHQGSLKIHMMRAHTREKPFVCSTCGKAFTTGADMKTHQKTHTGERPFACKSCDKRFSQCGQLKTHMRTHTGEKPYLCTECGKGFAHTSSLSVHMRGHSGERPYQCTVCDKKCTDSTNLKKHMRLHTGEKKAHVCPVCGQAFLQAGSLQKHMSVHTPTAATPPLQPPTATIQVEQQPPHHHVIKMETVTSNHADLLTAMVPFSEHMQLIPPNMATYQQLYPQNMDVQTHIYSSHNMQHHPS